MGDEEDRERLARIEVTQKNQQTQLDRIQTTLDKVAWLIIVAVLGTVGTVVIRVLATPGASA